jgi:cytochrome c oxidase subunit IV
MSEHVVSTRTYYTIFATLMVLTALTVWVATFDLGRLNVVAALTIAVVKATLVLLYFMHLRYSPRLTWLIVSVAFIWLAILIGLTLSDQLTRAWLQVFGAEPPPPLL